MDISLTGRRQIENEMIFRRANELVGDKLDELDSQYIQDGDPQLVRKDDFLLRFRCECSDENCNARIPIQLSVYQKIHEDRNAFVIKLKHQVNAIEKVTVSEDNYSVVIKNNSRSEPGDTLNKTSVNNT